MNATALIAEDEPLLAQALQTELLRAWPALSVVKVVGDGCVGDVSGFVSSFLSEPNSVSRPNPYELDVVSLVERNFDVGDGMRTAEYLDAMTAAVGQ